MAKFYFLGNATDSQMMGCIVQTQSKTVIIDGGVPGDAGQLAEFLRKNAGGVVDGWFFTHAHYDHIGAFHEIRKTMPDIKVKAVYHDFPTFETLQRLEPRTEWEGTLWREADIWTNAPNAVRMRAGDLFVFDEVRFTVLRGYNEKITENFVNNSSVVLRIDGAKSSVLILGDLGEEGGEEVIKSCLQSLLKADYTQMAHHGQRGVNKAFYEYIQPKKCLWAAPEWLWSNDKGEGFDSGPWLTVRTREWVDELGAKEHLVSKDGTSVFEI